MTDHTGGTMAWREETKLDYLERIAIALEKIAEKTPTPIVNQVSGSSGHEDPPVPGGYVQTKLCGDNDPNMPEKTSPCVRPKHHGVLGTTSHGGHKDSAGGEW